MEQKFREVTLPEIIDVVKSSDALTHFYKLSNFGYLPRFDFSIFKFRELNGNTGNFETIVHINAPWGLNAKPYLLKLYFSDYDCKAYIYDDLKPLDEFDMTLPYLKMMFQKFPNNDEYLFGFASSEEQKRLAADEKREKDLIFAKSEFDTKVENLQDSFERGKRRYSAPYQNFKKIYSDELKEKKKRIEREYRITIEKLDSLEKSILGKTLREILAEAQALQNNGSNPQIGDDGGMTGASIKE